MSEKHSFETYHGLILSLQDALLVLEATRLKILPNVRRRLNDVERKQILEGLVFAWNESECGMKRWTDGKLWLASKVKSPFLTYQEHDEFRNIKPNGLIKQIFSLTTKQNEKLHLVAYYDPKKRSQGIITEKVPSQDPKLKNIQLDPFVYLNDILHCYTHEPGSLRSENSLVASQTLPPPVDVGPYTLPEARLQPTPTFVPAHHPPPYFSYPYIRTHQEMPHYVNMHHPVYYPHANGNPHLENPGPRPSLNHFIPSYSPVPMPFAPQDGSRDPHQFSSNGQRTSFPQVPPLSAPYKLQNASVLPRLSEGLPKSIFLDRSDRPSIPLPAAKGVRHHPDDRVKLDALDKAFSV